MAFGAYAVLTGLVLIVDPSPIFKLIAMPLPADVWIKVVGVLAVVLGYYYWACGRAGDMVFFRASIVGRVGFFVLCGLLVLAYRAPAQLMLFGAVDLLGAMWTALAMRGRFKAGRADG